MTNGFFCIVTLCIAFNQCCRSIYMQAKKTKLVSGSVCMSMCSGESASVMNKILAHHNWVSLMHSL